MDVVKFKFSNLKEIYESEKHLLIKRVPELSYKALYPSNLECQKVSLALAIFDETNFAALDINFAYQTSSFVNLITSWWKMINMRTPLKSLH